MVTSPHPPIIGPSTERAIARLRRLNTQDIQSRWHQQERETSVETVFSNQAALWPIAPLNERRHVAWVKGCRVLWLHQSITIPTDIQGYPLSGLTLRLSLTWWADDAQIFIDGTLVQSGDLFECFTRLCLTESATPGQTIRVGIRLVSPEHDNGALVRSHLTYELPNQYPTPEPSFVADEMAVLATLEPDSQEEIEQVIAQLDWVSLKASHAIEDLNNPDSAQQVWEKLSSQSLPIPAVVHPFQQSLSQLRRKLRHYSDSLKRRQIQCVGHAHLDMAWLWPISDTWNAAERTFKSILDLQKDFSELTYTHTSPALFEWIENNKPELFQQIQNKVSEGSWSIDAGLWVEPEFNIISGESIVRQILYGQRYSQDKFGKISKIAWLPDSFGFCWQLPQLLVQGGVETFATLKLSWNDTTEFPHKLFWWQSPDGTRILSIMLPPIGSDIDPVKMSAHASHWEQRTLSRESLWLPGLGDHGGGPTRDMLEKAQRWKQSPFFPQLKFTTPQSYIDEISGSPSSALLEELPIWKRDLYLELHRGCYTTHADQKKHNRRCEDLLYQAEVFSTVAHLTVKHPYPRTEIEKAWKALLFNQFHDILPGTSIPEVFVDANKGWQKVYEIGQQILNESLAAITTQISRQNPPHSEARFFVLFNSLSWNRNAVVTLRTSESSRSRPSFNWTIQDATTNKVIPSQTHFTACSKCTSYNISFQAHNIPAIGYQCFWLCPSDEHRKYSTPEQYTLENKHLVATIDPTTGQIASFIDKATQTEIFSSPGNQLQAFKDKGQYWDAWNIDPQYEEHSLPAPKLQSIQWVENGPIHQNLRTTHRFQRSTIIQDYVLETGSPYLKIKTHIDWQETQVLLKSNFPFTIKSSQATYEIPFGAISRATNPQTEAEKAQWEVPALRWADLSNDDFGISILTNCKHGFDAGPSHLRLTLLKSPIWPDPKSDNGDHIFTYAIYPHKPTWQKARTAQLARELNIPPIVYLSEEHLSESAFTSQCQSFMSIQNRNIILSTLKLSENDDKTVILRCYEAYGEAAKLKIDSSLNISELESKGHSAVNLLEQQLPTKSVCQIKPWQVSTHLLKNRNQ